ncbi:sodium-dependent glucose transporter 1A-like [Ruditapes philippinarum]|uniref:sodium-dependent glucose transporter 1A-like n=1 Tax=Ruditapes philippinarum TaxID=129788 RepID=UPI00295BDEBB|nr:sodium-dependent glucose transporter 1A-like [Ruditapes philippinarum]
MDSTERPKEQTTVQKVVKTILLVVVWSCIGMCLEITGPTLIDLKIRIKTDYESISTAVSGRSAGFFIGSAIGGVLVDKFGLYCDLMVAVCLDLMAVSAAAIPWVPSTELIFFVSLCGGTFEGVINIAGQKLIINMWKENSASPLHILHGGFGIGSFIIPLIANPFLAKLAPDDNNATATGNVSCDSQCGLNFTTTPGSTTTTEKRYLAETSKIEYGYAIAGLIAIVVSVVFYTYHFCGSKQRKLLKEEQDNATNHEKSDTRTLSFREMFNPATCAGGRFLYGIEIFVLVFLFFMQAVGGERVGGKFIRAFSIDYHHFSTDDGSYINTVFWIAFACGRVLGFIVAKWIPIRILILIETGGCLASSIALVFLGTSGPLALWVIMPILAVFIAPLFPSGIGWANFHIEVTGIAITVFLLGGSLGGIIYMKLIGFLYDHYGPETFLYTLLGYGIAAFVLAVLMDVVGAQHGSRFNKDNTDDTKDIEMKNEWLTEKLEEDNKGYDASESVKDNEKTDNPPSYDSYQTFKRDNVKDNEFHPTSERL